MRPHSERERWKVGSCKCEVVRKSPTIYGIWLKSNSVMPFWIFWCGVNSTNALVTKRYTVSWTEGTPVGSCRNPNGEKIDPIFAASNTGSLNTGMYVIFLVQQMCAGLPHKVQNPDPETDNYITVLGIHSGCYFYLDPEVIR